MTTDLFLTKEKRNRKKWGTSINRVRYYYTRAYVSGKDRGKFRRRYGIVKKCKCCKEDFFIYDRAIAKGFNNNFCWKCFCIYKKFLLIIYDVNKIKPKISFIQFYHLISALPKYE